MANHRRRLTIALLSATLLAGVPALAACGDVAESAIENAAGAGIDGDVDIDDGNLTVTQSDGTQVQIGENLSVPENWPAEVPTYDGGKLMTVTVDGDGSRANAMWQTDTPVADVMAAYSAALAAAGYTVGTNSDMGELRTADFTGNGYAVTIMAITVDGATTMTVVAEKS